MYVKKKGQSYYTNRHSCFLLQYHMTLVSIYCHPVLTGGVKDQEELLSCFVTSFSAFSLRTAARR